jgi:opacity protein-like surface antigen
MKKLIILAALLAILTATSRAADWVEQGDGTWDLSVTVTAASTAEKDMFEQIRADHNYTYRYSGDALSASDWMAGLFEGFTATQYQDQPTVYKWCATLWQAFKQKWVSPADLASSSDDGDTEGLAVSVPAPPAAP